MPEIMAMLSGYIADIGVAASKRHIKEKTDEKKLKRTLQEYIERQRKYYDFCSLAKEFDYQGLVEYVKEHLLSDVEKRVFCVQKYDRKIARENVIAKAVTYSKAKTKESKDAVAYLVAISLDIIREFYKKDITKKEYLLATEIIDAVSDDTAHIVDEATLRMESMLTETNSKLDNIAKHTSILVRKSSNNIFSVDRAINIVETEGFGQIEDEYKKLFSHISVEHPLYPNYGYTLKNGKVQSSALTENAKILFPPKFVFFGSVCTEDKVSSNLLENPFDYAYRHQLQLIMNVTEAKKYLGDQLDPVQEEVSGFVGCELRAKPPSFPPAFPCAIKVGERTFFEYILLRTQEILDDGTFIIGNKEQETSHIFFEVQLNIKESNKNVDFKIKMQDASNHELLNVALFMKMLKEEKNLHIYVLSARTDMIAGIVNQLNYKTGFNSVEEELDFLKRLCAIEDYFDVKLNICGNITEDEYQSIVHISDMVMKNEAFLEWSESTVTVTVDDSLRKKLAEMDDSSFTISYVGIGAVELFGTKIEFRYTRTYKCAVMTDVKRIQKLVQFLHNDDSIKITFRPGEDNTVVDSLVIPEEFI